MLGLHYTCMSHEECDTNPLVKKVKSNYFIVRPKVDQRTGLLSLPHLGISAVLMLTTSAFTS